MNLLPRLHNAGSYVATISALFDNTEDIPPLKEHAEQEKMWNEGGIDVELAFRLTPPMQAIRKEHHLQSKLLRELNDPDGIDFETREIIMARRALLDKIFFFMLFETRVQHPRIVNLLQKASEKRGEIIFLIFSNWRIHFIKLKK